MQQQDVITADRSRLQPRVQAAPQATVQEALQEADLIHRSFDPEILQRVIDDFSDVTGEFDPVVWLANKNNVMGVEGESVGLATYDYLGVYTLHWFFKVKGREALDLARRMVSFLFDTTDAQTIRGLTRVDIRQARLFARKLGMNSYGIVPIDGKDYELFIMTKSEFIKKEV